ncbi:MAG: ETC complex I subunit, partial [Alphaproteobacteria bacterium]|nr:ETC complex I subunit [Alphaproteobacteria bacterium]
MAMKQIIIFEKQLPVNQSAYACKNTWFMRFAHDKDTILKGKIGWITSSDMDFQMKISFESLEKALTFAENNGYVIVDILHAPTQNNSGVSKSYA